jgi:NAD(P)-dependent dehydrogenase (short-subunit alcohol dehydrogenase family)
MVNRKEEQGANAIEDIKKDKADAQVEWKHCDMGNLKEVKEVFTELRNSLDRLDFLVLSAGINTNFYAEDSDGIDRHFGVNYLGHYYVCNQLWPLLRKTGKLGEKPAPRVVFESSEMHRTAPPDVHFGSLEEINDSSMDPTRLYGRTKLAMILFSKFGLRDRVIKPNGDNVYALAVHPGAVNTAMQQQWKDAYPGITGKLLSNAMLFAGRSVEQGSYSALWACTSQEIEDKDMNGFYFNDPVSSLSRKGGVYANQYRSIGPARQRDIPSERREAGCGVVGSQRAHHHRQAGTRCAAGLERERVGSCVCFDTRECYRG